MPIVRTGIVYFSTGFTLKNSLAKTKCIIRTEGMTPRPIPFSLLPPDAIMVTIITM